MFVIFFLIFFCETLKSDNIPLEVMSYVTFLLYLTVQSLRKTLDQWDNSSWRVLGFDTLKFSRLTADWLVKNMIRDMTPSGMSLDVSLSPVTDKSKNRINTDKNFNLF